MSGQLQAVAQGRAHAQPYGVRPEAGKEACWHQQTSPEFWHNHGLQLPSGTIPLRYMYSNSTQTLAPRASRRRTRSCLAAPMPTRTDCAALRAQATSWRTPTSSGSSMAAFGSWSTRWSSHTLERWCAQPPPTHHHPLATPPQLAADILVPVRLQEAAGPCKGVVMTGGRRWRRAREPGLHLWRTRLLHTVGRERCSRW